MRQFEGTTVLVADGDASDRELVAGLLERIGCVVHHAEDGAGALALTRRVQLDAVILDVALPDINGYDMCHDLRAHFGDTLAVILVSGTRVETLDRVAGFLIGADEYITKPFEPDELLVRVRSLLRRHGRHVNAGNGNEATSSLTAREREVLALLANGRNQAGIANELVVTPKTVATHIQRILAKLGVHSRAEAVAEAYRLRLVDGPFDAASDPTVEVTTGVRLVPPSTAAAAASAGGRARTGRSPD